MATKSLGSADFVHLHNHSHYSLLDGLQKIQPMLDRVKEFGMTAVALTDHGTLSGVIDFYQQAQKRDLKPIIGMEAYVAARNHTDKDPQSDRRRFHLVLLALNNQGYQNLMRLTSIAHLDGFYHKPRIDHQLLEKYNQGLIVLSGCMGGELGHYLENNQAQKALEIAKWYKKIFGDRYYIEIQDHVSAIGNYDQLNQQLLALASKLSIEAVVTSDAHYLNKDDSQAHEILLCVQTGAFLDETNRMSLADWDLHLADPKEIIGRWAKKHPKLISNTAKIAARCQVDLEFGKILLPKFSTPAKLSQVAYLRQLVWQGLSQRYCDETTKTRAEAKKLLSKEVIERAEYELKVIESMDFSGYFLITWDFCRWGKEQGIVFGPGRGSAAGSIIAYSLKITEVDPLRYGLLFERFLNPDRISMPDIDIDIQDTRRDEVIDYVINKYGQDRVASIVTFGKMAARNALRDVARVLRLPYAEAIRLAKMVPPPVQGRHIPLAKTLKQNQALREEYSRASAEVKQVFDMAIQLEGTIRSHGVHAAGVVIAPADILKFSPLENSQKGVITTQYSMGPIEDLGLLKMDFLGLSNLTTIKNALRIIKKVYQQTIDIDKLPLDDQATYELISQGDTVGIFQFESDGMRQYLRQLKPSHFEEVAAMTALYRPGPLSAGLTDAYIKRKQGKQEISVAHKAFAPILEETYGTLVYQEQVMRISRDVCGFSGAEADVLRKAIGKKIRAVMTPMERRFIDGGVEHAKVPKPIMEKMWQDIVGFADYAFNKSHSICYGLIAYQTAYLKANHFPAFMAALMSSDSDNLERLSLEISECQDRGLEVLGPDINESFHEFAVIEQSGQPTRIRFAFDAIKNVGHGLVAEIIEARDRGGHFKDIPDFLKRTSVGLLNRKAWESLIKAGVFDKFASRNSLLSQLNQIVSIAQKLQREASSGQTDLFGNSQVVAQEAANWQLKLELPEASIPNEYLAWERELLGLYISKHPLAAYEQYFSSQANSIAELSADNQTDLELVGMVKAVRLTTTKQGQQMAFVQFEDLSAQIDLIVFPDSFQQTAELWGVDNILKVTGHLKSNDSDELQLIVAQAQAFSQDQLAEAQTAPTQATTTKAERVYLRLFSSKESTKLLAIKKTLESYPGDKQVVLVLGPETSKQALRLPQQVTINDQLTEELAAIVGRPQVKTS